MTTNLEFSMDNSLYELVLLKSDNCVKYCEKLSAKQDMKQGYTTD